MQSQMRFEIKCIDLDSTELHQLLPKKWSRAPATFIIPLVKLFLQAGPCLQGHWRLEASPCLCVLFTFKDFRSDYCSSILERLYYYPSL